MIAVIQRAARAEVRVHEEIVGAIGRGLVVLLGIASDDGDRDVWWTADKVCSLRIFDDDAGKMNLDIRQVGGSVLVVSQFTLLGDCRKGRRPSFTKAAPPDHAETLYEAFAAEIGARGIPVATGQFRATMAVELVNDGPVTLILDSSASRP